MALVDGRLAAKALTPGLDAWLSDEPLASSGGATAEPLAPCEGSAVGALEGLDTSMLTAGKKNGGWRDGAEGEPTWVLR